LNFPRAQNNQSEEDKKVREKIKKQVEKLESLAGLESEANAIEQYHLTRPYIQTILNILIELNRLLDAKKKRLNAYSFADIGKMATRLMHDDQRRKTIQSMFDFIMIDEYQDTNDLQEAFIKLLANDNIMMVGDIKQSIYRFRNANSDIFKDKLARYTSYDQAEIKNNVTILLAKNYRSRSTVIEGINSIFERIMSQTYGGVDYGLGQALQFGQLEYNHFPSGTLEEGIETLWYEENPRFENAEIQAELIANHLTHLMNQGSTVVNESNKKKVTKTLQYEDVAILIDRKSKFKDYLKVFTERGIPLRIAADQSLSDSDLFRVFRNVMEVIAHFHGQDIREIRKPLMSMLRSFLFEESDERLYLLMTGKLSFSDFAAYPIVRQLVKDRTTHTLSQLVAKVFHDFSFETKILKIDDIAGNKARMLQLFALASNLEKQEYDLKQWMTFIEQADDMDIDLLIGEDRSSDNAVTLMTIHKSKGLEFPVVYLPGTDAKFNIQELNANFLVSNRYGIMLPLPHSPYPFTFFRHLVRHQGKMDALSEYLRLFYVATTRAKEKLVFLQSNKFNVPLSVPFAYSFSDFIHLSQSKFIRRSVPSIDRIQPTFTLPATTPKEVQLSTIDFPWLMEPPREIEKQFKEQVDSSVLDYGTYLHDLLFLVDFTTKDTSFIQSTSDRLLIDKILSLPLFQQVQGTVYKEYAYLNETTQRVGIMDMVIIDGNNATIVDYKTKDISNPSYDKQLERYRNYLLSQGFTTVKGYLISLIDGQIRNVF
jgi:ATP-dependent helicase/nuclease subunit A